MKKDLFNTFKVARLLAKDLAGCLDGEERRMLDDWLAEEASHRKFYAEMRMEAEQGMPARRYSDVEVERQLRLLYRRRERRVRRLGGWWRYAAGVALAAGIAGWIYWQMGNGAVEEAGMPVIDGQKGVTLVLADGEQMVLSDTLTRRDAEGRVVFRADGQSVAYGGDSVAVEVEGWNTLTVPRGMEFRAELADGSVVWLNAESELRYPSRFGGGRREVELRGEGYFDVARREGQAFVVRAGGVEVEVYGTEFTCVALAVLQNSFHDVFQLDRIPGLSTTAEYVLAMVTPRGEAFSYSDSMKGRGLSFASFFLADYFKRPEFLNFADRKLLAEFSKKNSSLLKRANRLLPLALLYVSDRPFSADAPLSY